MTFLERDEVSYDILATITHLKCLCDLIVIHGAESMHHFQSSSGRA
jgi:hypothetical protein